MPASNNDTLPDSWQTFRGRSLKILAPMNLKLFFPTSNLNRGKRNNNCELRVELCVKVK